MISYAKSEMAKMLISVKFRRRGDRDRVRINSDPHPITPCRSAGDREDLEPEVDLERMD